MTISIPKTEIWLSDLVLLMRDSEVSVDEFILIDGNVQTECGSIDTEAIASMIDAIENEDDDESGDEVSDTETQPEPKPLLSSTEMYEYAERIKDTALQNGQTEVVNRICECLTLIEAEITKRPHRQTTIDEFFTKCEFSESVQFQLFHFKSF